MPTTREDALAANGRYACVNQTTCGNEPRELPPFWYGRIVDVHSSGDYLKFRRRVDDAGRWYHRNDVHLHPLPEA